MDEAEMYYRTYAEIDGGENREDDKEPDGTTQSERGPAAELAHENNDSRNPIVRLLRSLMQPFIKSP